MYTSCKSFFFGQIQHGEQVVDVTVYAAVGQQVHTGEALCRNFVALLTEQL
jgi:hypothetical protein